MRKQKWTTEEIDLLLKNFDNANLLDLYNLFPNRSKYSVRNKAYRLKQKRSNVSNRNYKHTCNDDVFDELNECSLYWLGFLWADGHVSDKDSHIQINLSNKDREQLIRLKCFLECSNEIREVKNNKVALIFNSKKINDRLKELGMTSTKKFRTNFPDYMLSNEYYMQHFLRGYLDGDGSIMLCKTKQGKPMIKAKFTGCDDFIHSLGQWINEKFDMKLKVIKDKRSNAFDYCIGNRRKAIEFCEWLYNDANIYMDRKFDVFNENKKIVMENL
ncbi:MAG: hypothetical protein ACRDD7_18265 [Peptostreptococcaceae bacterium]